MKSASNGSDLTPQEFDALSRPVQLDLLRRVDPHQKMTLLLDAEQREELMAALPAQEVYQMVKAIGPEQCPDLLDIASPAQWTAFFDFECWAGDRIDPNLARFWVTLLLKGDGYKVMERLQQVNFELLVLILKKELMVLAGPDAIEDDDARAEAQQRDGGYQIEYRDEKASRLYGPLFSQLFTVTPSFYRYLLDTVCSESESLIEESVYQQRTGRLLDFGFPDPLEARLVYAWLDPEGFRADDEQKLAMGLADESQAPGFALNLFRPGGLLGEILDAGVDEATAWELTCLINKVTLADGIDVGDLKQIRGCIQKVYGLLEVALQSLAGTDMTRASELFRSVYCEHLFRLGFSLTLRLQRRASHLVESTVGPYLDRPFRAFLDPLLETCPRFYRGLEEEGLETAGLFSALHQVRLCEEWLDLLEVQQRLFEQHFDFALLPPEEFDLEAVMLETVDDLSLSELFLTALANRLLGRSFQPEPVAVADLEGLHRQVCHAGQLAPVLIEETVAWLDSLEPGGGSFAEYCLEFWQEAFCNISLEDLDPRFIGGILVRK